MSPLKPNSLTERDLIERSLKGDRKSQRDLFEMYSAKMLAVCNRYARHSAEAEDMFQEGFIKVFTNLSKFTGEGSFEGWIRRIMVNTSLKSIAKMSFKNESIGLEDYQEKDNKLAPDVFSKLSVDDLMTLVNDLPEGYRIVFNLFAIEGYSHKEIAAMLKVEVSTSRSQLVKARRMLQRKIEDLQKIAV
ncbi:MAG: RNA polymerase sigma factor (sigma-70 family) [Saprospiraceae bacterium]|jgi:RNA polymerase sigma-70 factor (ECF subfamily)